MAIGSWDVTIHKSLLSGNSIHDILFPLVVDSHHHHGGGGVEMKPTGRTWKCTLSIHRDGTFTLFPIVPHTSSSSISVSSNSISSNSGAHGGENSERIIEGDSNTDTNLSLVKSKNQENSMPISSNTFSPSSSTMTTNPMPVSSSSSSYMPLRGKWTLRRNPYCVTDRQHDELILKSYPRVKQQQQQQQQQRAIFEFRAKVWGRYGSRSIRKLMGWNHGRCMGQITNGTILLIRSNSVQSIKANENNDDYVPLWRNRMVCGTFRARARESAFRRRNEGVPSSSSSSSSSPEDMVLSDNASEIEATDDDDDDEEDEDDNSDMDDFF